MSQSTADIVEEVLELASKLAATPVNHEELTELLKEMQKVAEQTYWLFFRSGMGAQCHAFIEFNGLISSYVQMCERAAAKGIDFRMVNTHNGGALPMEVHQAAYIAEKLECIFGPSLRANPEAAEAFKRGLGI